MRAEARECDLGVVEVDVGRAVRGSHGVRDALEVIGLPAIIGVEERDPCRGCLRDATVACCRASRLRLADASQRPAEALEQLGRSVGRPVVDDHDFGRCPGLAEDAFDRGAEALFPAGTSERRQRWSLPRGSRSPGQLSELLLVHLHPDILRLECSWNAAAARVVPVLSPASAVRILCSRRAWRKPSCAGHLDAAAARVMVCSFRVEVVEAGDWSIPAAAFSLSALSVSSLR